MKRAFPLGLHGLRAGVVLLGLGSAAFAQSTSTPPTPPTTPAPAAPSTPTTPRTTQPSTTPAAPTPRPAFSCGSYIVLGNSYFADQKFDSAYVAFKAATECNPRSSDALLGLGRTQTRLRLYSAAIETLRKLMQQDARNISAYIALAQAYTAQYVGTTDRDAVKDNLDQALRVLTDAQTILPSSAAVWNERSNVFALRGDYTRAIDAAKQAVALAPDNATVLYNLGDLYYATNQLPLAVTTLQRAVIAEPQNVMARAYYGKLLMVTNQMEAARLELAQALRLAPQNAYVLGQNGVFAYLNKDAATAKTRLDAALNLAPTRYPEFYYYRGRLAFDGNQLRDARSDLTKAAALALTNPEYFFWLGRANEASGDKVAAREAYGEAVRLNPNYQEAQTALTRVR